MPWPKRPRLLGCDVAVSATGIAGPGGAEPASRWHRGIGRADASLTCARCCHFPGTREEVRLLAGVRRSSSRSRAGNALERRRRPRGIRMSSAWKTRWIGRCCALDARHRDVSRPRYTGVASFFAKMLDQQTYVRIMVSGKRSASLALAAGREGTA
ncbi:MAG: CinA family protein [Adlercreutzia sp.]